MRCSAASAAAGYRPAAEGSPLSTALVWFRRDFRLADHPALSAALARHERVIPVYIHAPDEEAPWSPGAASDWWRHHSLTAFAASLAAAGSRLLIRRGPSLPALRALAAETGATAVYWTRLYEPALIARDRPIKAALREDGLDVESDNAALLAEPWTVKTGTGEPYRVFSPFWRQLGARTFRTPLPAPGALPPVDPRLPSLAADALGLRPRLRWDLGFHDAWTPGEAGAWARLDRFGAEAAAGYAARRDLPAVEGTSGLSPHLHFGEISPVQIAARLRRLATAEPTPGLLANVEHYVRELGWREFAHHLLFHFPATTDTPLVEKFKTFPWRARSDYATDLRAWQRGRTGLPIVDAGMRQLWASGWMHNRVRMVVASFLTKNLLIPWQEGARWFWDTLVDASLANNTLGWQWSAGCGADAAPYFRIFNPVLQSGKFDPDGRYLARWVPELAGVRADRRHAPWTAQDDFRLAAGPGNRSGYPSPIIDLRASRNRALAAYGDLRNG